MITSCSLCWRTSCTVLYCTVLYFTVLYCTSLHCTVLYCRTSCTIMYCTVLYCTALYFVVVQDQLLSNIAADHHEEPGEVVALVSNPLQPDQVGTCSLYWTQYTLLVFFNIDRCL